MIKLYNILQEVIVNKPSKFPKDKNWIYYVKDEKEYEKIAKVLFQQEEFKWMNSGGTLLPLIYTEKIPFYLIYNNPGLTFLSSSTNDTTYIKQLYANFTYLNELIVNKPIKNKYISIKLLPNKIEKEYSLKKYEIGQYLKSIIDSDHLDSVEEWLNNRDGYGFVDAAYYVFDNENEEHNRNLTEEDIEKWATTEMSFWFNSDGYSFPFKKN